ncbi:MAG: hypothetical protein RIR00_2631 [Pseudomonadota bacterium]
MTDAQRIEQARQAKMALDNFLTPAFEIVEADYAEKMITAAASVDPRAPEIIARLANAIKATRMARQQIEAIVADGIDAKANRDRAERIATLTPAQRKLLNIGQH